MEHVLRDFWMISKPLKTIYENQGLFSEEAFKEANEIKIFEIAEERYFGLAIRSGIFFEMSKKACEELKKKKRDKSYRIISSIDEQLQMMAKIGVFAPNIIKTKYEYISKMNLNLCHICNLRCKYCFAEGGAYGREERYMTEDTAKKAVDLFIGQLPDNTEANIILFGGEPLINMYLMKWIIRYADETASSRNIKVIYDIFTNGTLIDESIMHLMRENENVRILLSMDGPAEINDYFRGAGKKSITEIIEKNMDYIRPFLDKRVVVRCTVGWVKEDLLERIQYFVKKGFKNIVIDPAYCKDMPDIDNTDRILHSIVSQLPRVSDYLIHELKQGNSINVNLVSEMMAQVLKNGNGEGNYEVPQCPGGRCYVAIDSTGDIYPCHYFVGTKEYSYGNVNSGSLKQKNMITDNGKKNLEKCNDDLCQHCELAVICEGACPYKNLLLYPDSSTVREKHCEYMLRRTEESLKVLSKFYDCGKMPYLLLWDILFKEKIENMGVK